MHNYNYTWIALDLTYENAYNSTGGHSNVSSKLNTICHINIYFCNDKSPGPYFCTQCIFDDDSRRRLTRLLTSLFDKPVGYHGLALDISCFLGFWQTFCLGVAYQQSICKECRSCRAMYLYLLDTNAAIAKHQLRALLYVVVWAFLC